MYLQIHLHPLLQIYLQNSLNSQIFQAKLRAIRVFCK
jgi:hypothetical protein